MARRFKIKKGNFLIVPIAALALIYFLGRYAMMVLNPIETVAAVRVTMDDVISVNGYFIRDEQVIPAANGNMVEYSVLSGEKVNQGAELAVEYQDASALAASRSLRAFKEQLSRLTNAEAAAGDLSDISKLDQLMIMQMKNISDAVHDGNVTGFAQAASELRSLALERGITAVDAEAVAQEKQRLTEQIAAAQANMGSRTSRITSPFSGYFSETVDGYENILRASDIDLLTPSRFKQLEQPQLIEASTGKIIDGFEWYFAVLVSESELGALETGDRVLLRFAQTAEDISATVYDVRREARQPDILLLLKGTTMNSEIVSMRRQPVDIIRGSYSGLKVPLEALRMRVTTKSDGTEVSTLGVYVLNGTISKFKKVDILFEGETDCVVRQINDASGNSLVPMDDIIVKAKELSDSKVVK